MTAGVRAAHVTVGRRGVTRTGAFRGLAFIKRRTEMLTDLRVELLLVEVEAVLAVEVADWPRWAVPGCEMHEDRQVSSSLKIP